MAKSLTRSLEKELFALRMHARARFEGGMQGVQGVQGWQGTLLVLKSLQQLK